MHACSMDLIWWTSIGVLLAGLQVYQEEAQPLEDFFRRSGLLLDFEITSGIPETLPRLQAALLPHLWRNSSSQARPAMHA